jgi:peptide/nickel transport system substrate-binding protein
MKNFFQLILVLVISLDSFSVQARALPTNKELNIGITQEFENMNPIIMSMLATTYLYRMTNRTLMVLDENTEWVPQLAKEIPTLENGQARRFKVDGKEKIEADWQIREAARWGDGKPVTCHDFKLSWDVGMNPNVAVSSREAFEEIEEIRIDSENPKKCTFVYKDAKWTFNRVPNFYALPTHLERPVFEKYGDKAEGYERQSLYSREPTHPGLFHGPYRISEIRLGSHLILERNPYYYGEAGKIERIVVKLIPNTGTLEANLRSGTIDMISVLGMSFDQAIAFNQKVKSENLPFNVNFRPSLVYEHIDLNLDNPFLQDQRVRQALVYAIDRQGLTNALFDGKQPPALHSLSPLDPWFTKDPEKIVIYPYRRRIANQLLDEAGWKMREDGYRYNEGGERFRLTLMTTAGNRVRELVQVYLQDQWKSIGIDLRINNEPARVFFGQTTSRRNFTGMAMYAWVSSPENNPRNTFGSDQIPNEGNSWSGQNYPGWKNARVDELVEKLDLEFDPEKRISIIHEVLYHYTSEVPVIPLYYRSDTSVTPKNLTGYQIPGHQYPASNHVERWSLISEKELAEKSK